MRGGIRSPRAALPVVVRVPLPRGDGSGPDRLRSGPRSAQLLRTITVSSIHGWMAQKNKCVPGVRVAGPIVVVPPLGTKLNGPKKNVGGVGVPNRTSLI